MQVRRIGLAAIAAAASVWASQANAQCARDLPPASIQQAELKSAAFDPAKVAAPILQLNFDSKLAALSAFEVEYSAPKDRGAPSVIRAPIDPSKLQLLQSGDGRAFIDLRAAGLVSDAYKRARIVMRAPKVDLPKQASDQAALIRSIEMISQGLQHIQDYDVGGQTIAVPLSHLPAGTGAAASPDARLRDALVLIRTDKGQGYGDCNGAYIGGGRILTARHCLSDKMWVLFGQTWPAKAPIGDDKGRSGEVVCPGKGSALVPLNGADGPMDIAIIELPAGFQTSPDTARFAAAALDVERPIAPPTTYRMAATWTAYSPPIAWTPNSKPYTPARFEKHLFAPPEGGGTPGYSWCQGIAPPLEDPDCVQNQYGGISRAGWRHRCPTVPGISGAPLFDGTAKDFKVIAVMTGDSVAPNNCATRATALPAF
jgi:hypothetical protein